MSRIKKRAKFAKALDVIGGILPMIFWGLVLFSFEDFFLATTTLVCALIHELGHILCIAMIRENGFGIRSVISGFRIKTHGVKSYDEEMMIYLAGPCANILVFAICIFLSRLTDERLLTIGMINLITALSNLMPIKGYDGYGAICALTKKYDDQGGVLKALSLISSSLIFIFSVFSLYLIDRYAGGYWVFAIFFVSMIKEIKVGLGE